MRLIPESRNVCELWCSHRSWALDLAFFQMIYSVFRFGGWAAVCWINLDEGCDDVLKLLQCAPYVFMQFIFLILTVGIFRDVYKNAEAKMYFKKLMFYAILKGLEICLVTLALLSVREIPCTVILIVTWDTVAAMLYGVVIFIHSQTQTALPLLVENNNNNDPVKEPEPVNV